MRLSIETLNIMSHAGYTDATLARQSMERLAGLRQPSEAYYMVEGDMIIIHTPKNHITPGAIIARRPYTLVGMPAAVASGSVIVTDDDGEID